MARQKAGGRADRDRFFDPKLRELRDTLQKVCRKKEQTSFKFGAVAGVGKSCAAAASSANILVCALGVC